MNEELIKRLRKWGKSDLGLTVMYEAADTIETQAAEIERLREAAMDAHDALVFAKAFIFQKHATQNRARNEAIDKLRAILGDPARAALGETE
jgi:hypothetical protein